MTTFISNDGTQIQYNGKDFAITKQTISFIDFKIKGDVSVNFKIPNTSENRTSLGYHGLKQIPNGAYSKNAFNVVRNGNKISSGYIFIQGDNGEEIECFFISGNSNWINKFQFACNEVVNPIYSINWEGAISGTATIYNNRNNKHGIVFPIIDYIGDGLRGSDNFCVSIQPNPSEVIGSPEEYVPTLFPCLWVHTLVEEIIKLARINLAGDLLTDSVYNSLIITPDSPELIDPVTGLKIYQQRTFAGDGLNHVITIGAIAPKEKAIELIKYLCISFGCIPIYDVESNTLTLNKIKSIDRADSYEWTPYVRGYDVDYDQLKSNLTIANKQPDDLNEYNKVNEVQFGDLMVTTGREDSGNATIYNSPFVASGYRINAHNGSLMGIASVRFYQRNVVFQTTFSSVTISGSAIRFSGLATAPPFGTGAQSVLVEIIDNNRVYTGFYNDCTVTSSVVDIIVHRTAPNNYYKGSSTGTVKIYSVSTYNAGHRILRCKTDVNVSSFSMFSTLYLGSLSNASTVSYAWYSKRRAWPDLNNETSINYGDIERTSLIQGKVIGKYLIDSPYVDVNLSETHLKTVIQIMKNPAIRARLQLPESDFFSFNHNKFVHIDYEDLNGYFYCPKIENYVDGEAEVMAYLFKID